MENVHGLLSTYDDILTYMCQYLGILHLQQLALTCRTLKERLKHPFVVTNINLDLLRIPDFSDQDQRPTRHTLHSWVFQLPIVNTLSIKTLYRKNDAYMSRFRMSDFKSLHDLKKLVLNVAQPMSVLKDPIMLIRSNCPLNTIKIKGPFNGDWCVKLFTVLGSIGTLRHLTLDDHGCNFWQSNFITLLQYLPRHLISVHIVSVVWSTVQISTLPVTLEKFKGVICNVQGIYALPINVRIVHVTQRAEHHVEWSLRSLLPLPHLEVIHVKAYVVYSIQSWVDHCPSSTRHIILQDDQMADTKKVVEWLPKLKLRKHQTSQWGPNSLTISAQ